MKCSVCKKDLVGEKVKQKGKWEYVSGAAALFAGPIGMTVGALTIATKILSDDVEMKCPHCKAKLTLSKAEFKTLKEEYRKKEIAERRSKQNRIIK